MRGSRVKGGHPFKAGTVNHRAKPRTQAVREAARRTIRKAQSTRYLGARGERHR